MKFSSKCRTKKLEMKNTILGSFYLFFNWEGANIRPQIRPWKILVVLIQESGICMYGKPRNCHEIILTIYHSHATSGTYQGSANVINTINKGCCHCW